MRFLFAALLLLALPAQAQISQSPAPFSSGSTVTATGSTTARTLQDRAAERLNVRDFGATGDGTTDDSAAFAAAITLSNTKRAAGTPTVIYAPTGRYLIAGTQLPTFVRAGSVVGEGPHQTYIVIDPSYAGDLFSWSEAWMATDYPGSGTLILNNDKAGPVISGFTVVGTTTAAAQQNAFVFYDRNDHVTMRDVEVFYLNGRCLYVGALKNTTEGYMRESKFNNVQCWYAGTSTVGAVELSTAAAGHGDSTNELSFYGLDIELPTGKGLVIRNGNTTAGVRLIRFYGLRVELGPAGDLVTIGDPTLTGNVNNVKIYGFEANAMASGFAALRLTAQAAASMPYNIAVEGSITTGAGSGIKVDAGRGLRFQMADLVSTQTNITVGAAPLVGQNIEIDGNGAEAGWTYAIDASATNFVRMPAMRFGTPSLPVAVAANVHLGDTASGSALGSGAVDLSSGRNSAFQAATAQYATIGGGFANAAQQVYSTQAGGQSNSNNAQYGFGGGGQSNSLQAAFAGVVTGGTNNLITANFSAVPGGSYCTDRGRFATFCYSGGKLSVQGDAQITNTILRGTTSTTAAIRLTADQNAAAGGNCLNIPNATAYTLRVSVSALDHTTVANNYSWTLPNGLLTRGANAASTAWSAGTPVTLSNGSVTGLALAASADTTNGCLNLSFTPPTSNADTWNVVARVETVEVQ